MSMKSIPLECQFYIFIFDLKHRLSVYVRTASLIYDNVLSKNKDNIRNFELIFFIFKAKKKKTSHV